MAKNSDDGARLLDVKYVHEYKKRGAKVGQMCVMHPFRIASGEGAGKYSIRKVGVTKRLQYISESELVELFAVNGFKVLGINIRMMPVGSYVGGEPPALEPSRAHVVAGSLFDIEVKKLRAEVDARGLSASLCAKLDVLHIAIPQGLMPRVALAPPPPEKDAASTSATNPPTGVDTDDEEQNADEEEDPDSQGRQRAISEEDLWDILNR